MPTAIRAIQAQRRDFRTQANADWVADIAIRQAGQGGVVAGSGNTGNGVLTVSSVAPETALGAHRLTITSAGSPARFTVQDPDGVVTRQSAVGLATQAGGLAFTLSAGSNPFAVGDAFAIGVLPIAVDLTGIAFDLHARKASSAASIDLSATSHPSEVSDPVTIIVNASDGNLSLQVPRSAMAADRFAPGTYVYDILATADGLTIPALYGVIEHVAGVSRLP